MLKRGEFMFYIEAIDYLEHNFGFDIKVNKWEDVDKLPVFLSKGYDYAEMMLPGNRMLLMNCSRHQNRSIDVIKTHIIRLRKLTGYKREIVVIYMDASYYHRKRMVSEKMSFIVPGKQIYIPVLGTIFTEKQQDRYSVGTKNDIKKMSPTTQALFLELMCTNDFDRPSSEYAKTLNVTPMSISRAFSELDETGIIHNSGSYYLSGYSFKEERKTLWHKIYDSLSNPVIKRIYIRENSINEVLVEKLVISGESALSRISMLGSPSYSIYGITSKEFKKLTENVSSQPFLDEGACEIELWRYQLPKRNGMIHPLGIALVLKDEADERVQDQIEQIIREYDWEE